MGEFVPGDVKESAYNNNNNNNNRLFMDPHLVKAQIVYKDIRSFYHTHTQFHQKYLLNMKFCISTKDEITPTNRTNLKSMHHV